MGHGQRGVRCLIDTKLTETMLVITVIHLANYCCSLQLIYIKHSSHSWAMSEVVVVLVVSGLAWLALSVSPFKAAANTFPSSRLVLTPCFACSSAILCRLIASNSSSAIVHESKITHKTENGMKTK